MTTHANVFNAAKRRLRGTRQSAAGNRPHLRDSLPEVRSTFAWLRNQEPQFAQWQLEMARIPASPFGETARAQWLEQRFSDLGLEEISIDEVGNVTGVSPGRGQHCVAISAHIDTVFPPGTPLNIRQQGSRLYGPGVSDNGAGVTALLAVAAALRWSRLAHALPILFIGNVGEEGEGDLRGMRHIFAESRWERFHPFPAAARRRGLLDHRRRGLGQPPF